MNPLFDEQLDTIRQLLNTAEMKEGDSWFLVDTHWFKQWKRYVGWDTWDQSVKGQEIARPGSVNNAIMLKESGSLKAHLTETFDYHLLPMSAWDLLVSWFGLAEGQNPIERKVISQGLYVKHLKVEVYLTEISLNLLGGEKKDEVKAKFSRAEKLRSVVEFARKAFSVDPEKETRLWNKYLSNSYEALEKYDDTLQDCSIYTSQNLVLEVKSDDGTWPKVPETRQSSDYYNSYSSSNYQEKVKEGLTGLSNLGNTCFMNSALQCLSNVPQLTEYFRTNDYRRDINYDNPLGMRGRIAEAYGQLMQDMWRGRPYVTPRSFKSEVGKFAPRFTGYQQHDSQELLAFLLDGLHEDLNRVVVKPYVEVKDSNGRPDEEVAEEAWQSHLLRNRSVIVDIIQGQYKSELVCPECKKISVCFDPFMYLTLPLPVKRTERIFVTVVRADSLRSPEKYCVVVRKDGRISDLQVAIERLTKISAKQLAITDIYGGKIYKIFADYDEIRSIYADREDIHAYELPTKDLNDPDTALVVCYYRLRDHYSPCFGLPMLLGVPRHETKYVDLYKEASKHMSRFLKMPAKVSAAKADQTSVDNGEKMDDTGGENGQKEGGDSESMDCSHDNNDVDVEENGGQNENKKRLIELASESSDGGDEELFEMSYANLYGSSNLGEINREEPIHFKETTYVFLEWRSELKRKYYDEEKAQIVVEHESAKAPPEAKKKTSNLHDCIKLFTETETLSEEDPWYCSQCEEHRQADKTMTLWKLPEVLVVHLKRFSYSRYWRDKLDTYIDFPIESLDMTEYVLKGPHKGQAVLYDLCAVSNHYGGMGGGHYTAYCKNKTTDKWHHFDDSSVSEVREVEGTVRSKAAYVLIYLRKEQKQDFEKKDSEEKENKVEKMDDEEGNNSSSV